MRIALFIQDGTQQVVLTPEGDTEKSLLKAMAGKEIEVKWGSFYACQGGWVRMGEDTDSAILVLHDPR